MSFEIGAAIMVLSSRYISEMGSSDLKPALTMSSCWKESMSRIIIAVRLHHLALAIRAAGFIATRRSQ